MQEWNPPVKRTTTATQCGPLMVRYVINGKEVLLPCDAILRPVLSSESYYEPCPLSGTY
jgi:hypothetical protein